MMSLKEKQQRKNPKRKVSRYYVFYCEFQLEKGTQGKRKMKAIEYGQGIRLTTNVYDLKLQKRENKKKNGRVTTNN